MLWPEDNYTCSLSTFFGLNHLNLCLKHPAGHVTQLIRSKNVSLDRETTILPPYIVLHGSLITLAYCLKIR